MPASKAKMKAIAKYEQKAYDKILLRFPKGASETLKALATAEGESVNRYILVAIEQRSGQKFALNKSIAGGEETPHAPAPTQAPAPTEKEITLKIKISVDE